MTRRPTNRSETGLMRSLGRFTGHILRAVRADPGPERTTVRRETEEQAHDTPEARITLRRTTVEEIEIEPHERGPRDA